ncbi:hypothetical protein G7046_g7456 [Stylonectria norvegica]|nr:hypothetical protein G7046_g7456 [Stylonectria norvegica]
MSSEPPPLQEASDMDISGPSLQGLSISDPIDSPPSDSASTSNGASNGNADVNVHTQQRQPSTDKPYHSKRPHKKSRAGCKNCKARKVKCDEARPACRSCKLRRVECVYPPPPPPATTSYSVPSTPPKSSGSMSQSPEPSSSFASKSTALTPSSWSSRGPSPIFTDEDAKANANANIGLVSEPLFHPGSIDTVDMRLLWFYTTATATSFSVDAGGHTPVEDILKVRMVQIAFETPFLMDSLFALSSLHLQSLKQDYDPGRALAYRVRSFAGYRKAVEEAKPEDFPALVANSLFLTALSSQVFRDDDSKELYIIDWMIVWRGIGLITELMGHERLFAAGLADLFYRPPINLDEAAAAIPNHLLFMVSSIKPDDVDYPDIDTYYETLKYLGSLYYNLKKGLGSIMNLRIITWFTFLPREFVQLGRERRPRALIIIAHYVAFIKIVQNVWWMDGVGDRSLADICNYLSAEWQHLLLVPQMARHVQGELPIARIILGNPDWKSPQPTSAWVDGNYPIALMDDAGRRIKWMPDEKKLVLLDPRAPDSPPQWNT